MSELRRILEVLKQHRVELRRLGVANVGVFGSIARNEQQIQSDVDFLVRFEEGRAVSYSDLYELYTLLRRLTGRDVDLVTDKSLSEHMKPYVEKELQYVDL